MCGICGVYNYRTGEPVSRELLSRMTASMAHRGPDDDGFLVDADLGLGMRRLSIIDLEGGGQPIASEDGAVSVVLNGEIYNYRDLRRELESHGHRFATRSDTETVVHAYEQWGLDCLHKLNGMFGLAIWDERTRCLVVARDPFGVKPLYFRDDGRRLLFGSEIRAILQDTSVDRAVDLTALDEFLTLTFVPAPRTAFRGIHKLRPGHALVCRRGGIRTRRFYGEAAEDLSLASDTEIIDGLRTRIATAVERQMVADVPIGAMLSGGVDSSAIASVMAGVSDRPIRTFTVGFENDFALNELDHARNMARRLGSEHHEIAIGAEEFDGFLPLSIWFLEEPIATASTLPFYKVCELARSEVKVVLTGQGADEPFAGYPRHFGVAHAGRYRALPTWLRRSVLAPLVERLPRNERLKRAVRSLDTDDPIQRMVAVYTIADPALKSSLYREGICPTEGSFEAVEYWARDVVGRDELSRMLYVDARMSLPDNLLTYGDKMSMAVSLEARVPFLDLELMRYAEGIPARMKIAGRSQKDVLKKAVSKWVPPEVLSRPKIGFTTPVDEWFRRELRESVAEKLLDAGSGCREYFRPDVLEGMLADHASGRQDHKRSLFSLLTFELWHQLFIRPTRLEPPGGVHEVPAR